MKKFPRLFVRSWLNHSVSARPACAASLLRTLSLLLLVTGFAGLALPAVGLAQGKTSDPVLRTYPIQGNAIEVAAQWQSLYAQDTRVRIAVDQRLSQILVLAPADVQEQLAQSLAMPAKKAAAPNAAAGAANPAPNFANPAPNAIPNRMPLAAANNPGPMPLPPPNAAPVQAAPMNAVPMPPPAGAPQPEYGTLKAPAADGASVTRQFRLHNLRGQQLEDNLAKLWGKPLPKAKTEGKDSTMLVFDAPGGRKLTLEIDRPTNEVSIVGPAAIADAWVHVVEAEDSPPPTADHSTRVVSLTYSDRGNVHKALDAVVASGEQLTTPNGEATAIVRGARSNAAANEQAQQALKASLLEKLFQPKNSNLTVAQADPNAPPAPRLPNQPAAPVNPVPEVQPMETKEGGLIGPVQIEFLDGLDIIVIRGHPKDVERITQIINDIERISAETTPAIEIYQLKNVAGDLLATLIRQLNDQILVNRNGQVSITPLDKPNALLLVGRKESVKATIELIEKLDQPVPPASQFQVFQLKHTSAGAAQQTLQEFYANRPGLGTRALVSADTRSNSLIVQASPRDLAEVDALLKKIDVAQSAAVNELRVFALQNTLANDIAPILQDAVNGQILNGNQRRTGANGAQQIQQNIPGQQNQPGQNAANLQNAGNQPAAKSAMLRFMTIDSQGGKDFKSGILTDVHISADPRSNSLLITAPTESMDLLAALVRQLDQMPAAESQIKVFTIVNGDAQSLAQLLQNLFGQSAQSNGNRNANNAAAQFLPGFIPNLASDAESVLVPLRFSVDQRTNSIVVSGSAGDLSVVEAILLRLDASDIQQRKNAVYRLKNAPATDVATAINQFLTNQRQLQTATPTLLSPFEQIEREVIVVPEPVNNSLIISATPRYFEEMKKIVEQLDARPPMVMIQVLIAEITLTNTDEFGIELGLQDSVLFDRSLLGDLVTTTQTTTFGNPPTTTENQNVVAASNTPGFNFVNQPLGNSGSTNALANAATVGTQGLSDFGVGRTNSQLGFGGLVLSASSQSVSALLRALRECRRTDVLSRPQIMTLDNQAAFIQVGQRVPQITGVSTPTSGGQINTVTTTNVGVILGVTPRISPDGLVVMEVDAEKSEVGADADGIPISISPTGQVIRSPKIDVTVAQTTVSALSGQTVILGGLITKSRAEIHRRVPLLSDIPILGNLFRYDYVQGNRTELLIILTPRIVRTEQDSEKIKQVEAGRMSWCLADVIKIHGESGLRGRNFAWGDGDTQTVYPDLQPTAGEVVPTPAIDGAPSKLPVPPAPIMRKPNAGNGLPELAPKPLPNPPSTQAAPLNPAPTTPLQAPLQNVPPTTDGTYNGGRPSNSNGPQMNLDSARRGPTARPAVEEPSGVEQTKYEWPVAR
ncbi:MAG TPA: secretin N-terminal domain-containing protein [Pirellulales bacterium]|jgi:type II secretion system protein D|nr:secretin N-terminal domain-containing protein [Pirellulales bacterium]